MRTLVIHAGGIGDLLLAGPSIKELAREGPVDLAGIRSRLELLVAGGVAQTAHDLAHFDFESVFVEPSERFRERMRLYDRCVVWMRDDGTIREALHACGVADVRVFPGLPPPDWNRHASEYYFECLGIERAEPLRLAIPPAASAFDIVIHPGSGSPRKNWPLERFQIVADKRQEAGRNVGWCAGPAEETLLPHGTPVLRCDSLVALARELAAAPWYLGNDSGITHLAAACGARTVAVFGPTDPAVWAPRGERVAVMRGTPWPDVNDVLDALAIQ